MHDEESKKRMLQRILAGKNGVPIHDVNVTDFLEGRKGVYCVFYIDGNREIQAELITWWTIAFSA